MPSEIAKQFVDYVFADEKSKAIDAANDGFGAATFDAVQQKKIEFAQQWGFDIDDTGQDSADEIANNVYDDSDDVETEIQPEEETTDEDDETNR